MDTNNEKLLAKEEVFQIVGCAIEVLNALGHGLLEKPYENGLGSGVWSPKHSFSAAAGLQRPLQRTKRRAFYSGPDRV